MNKQPCVVLAICFCCIVAVEAQVPSDSLATRILTPAAMQEDFNFLRRVLTETHPGLYRYTSKEKMQRKMDSLYALLDKPMPFYDFYKTLSSLIADVRCAHTYIIPRKNLEQYYLRNTRTFPHIIFYTGGKYFVMLNGTSDATVKPGFELLTINGRPIGEIRKEILRHTWADGYNETLKSKNISEAYFPMFYYTLIERPETFDLTFLDFLGKEIKVKANAQPYKTTENLYLKNPVNKQLLSVVLPRNKVENKKPWRLDIRKSEKVGVIRIRSFGGGNTEEEARNKMTLFMEDCVKKLSENNIQDIIIDLRFNGGGWDIQGVELFTYLMKEPTRCYRRLYSISDSTDLYRYSDLSEEDLKNVKKELRREADGTFSIREEFSEQLKIQMPKKNRFAGNVYVLANGGTASAASEFVAFVKSSSGLTVIGEETGGVYEGGNGGSFLKFELPNSRFSVGTPLLAYDNEVKAPVRVGRGAMPDHEVPYNIPDILSGIDTQLNFALDLIRKSHTGK